MAKLEQSEKKIQQVADALRGLLAKRDLSLNQIAAGYSRFLVDFGHAVGRSEAEEEAAQKSGGKNGR